MLLALSGGVDSSVVAALLLHAIGDQLTCVHVNHGLLRKGEPEQVVEVFQKQMGANLIYVDASQRFLDKLALLGRSLFGYLRKRPESWKEFNFLLREPFIPILLRAVPKLQKW